jgi:hypothetical protein
MPAAVVVHFIGPAGTFLESVMVQDKQAAVNSAPDAVALRMADHLEVDALFERYERLVSDGAVGAARRKLAETICVTLTVHITAEEELFYPAAREAIGTHDILHEASAVHHSARHLIADIVNMATVDPLLDATVRELRGRVGHHVRREEGLLFAKLKTAGVDLGALGARIVERKSELRAEMEEVEA